eukprot:jgi/Ulvmu1/5114/UM021_0131.1
MASDQLSNLGRFGPRASALSHKRSPAISTMFFAKRRPEWAGPQALPAGLNLASSAQAIAADTAPEDAARTTCPSCRKSRSWYCPECPTSLCETPQVRLPVTVKIVTHPQEKRTKCTGVQAVLLARENVQLLEYTQVPEEESLELGTAAVLFPTAAARTPDQLDLTKITTVFVIDSAWKKARGIMRRPEYKKMVHIRLSGSMTSSFWRFHTKGVTADSVCTIEALFFFFRELQQNDSLDARFKVLHCFDNLLWYFAQQHQAVNNKYEDRKKRRLDASTSKHLDADEAAKP